jgi:hypothetical protein
LDFQQCVKSYGESDPTAEHLKKGISAFVSPFPSYRHCIGTYVTDKNAVITALGTLVIAVFTTVLGVFTISLAGSTRITADAAKKSADAAYAAERARFYIVIETATIDQLIDGADRFPLPTLYVKYYFKNYGKTPGIIKELCIGSAIAAEPVEPTFTLAVENFPENMIGANSRTEPTKTLVVEPIPIASQAFGIRDNTQRLWVFGRLYYDDVFGEHQVHRFYLRSVTAKGTCFLRPYDHEDHNKST